MCLHHLHLRHLHVPHHRLSPQTVGVLGALSLLMFFPTYFGRGNALAAFVLVFAACAVPTLAQIPIL